MTLHILNQKPDSDSFSKCLGVCLESDEIVLIEDAVEAAADESLCKLLTNTHRCYALDEHLAVKDITLPQNSHIKSISYIDFIDLCTQKNPVVSW